MISISDRVKEVLEWTSLQNEIAARCITVPGKSCAGNMAPIPLDAIQPRMRKISEMKEMRLREISPDLSGIEDIDPLLTRSEKAGALSLEELGIIRLFIIASQRIKNHLGNLRSEFTSFEDEYHSLDDLKAIGGIIIPALTEAGELSERAYPQIRRYRESIFELKKDIEKRLNGIIISRGMETVLQEKISMRRSDRYTLLVKANMKGKITGNVMDVSASGSTLYMEPDSIRPLNNELIIKERELTAEIQRILASLSSDVAASAGQLRGNMDIAAGIDLITAAASFSEATRSSEPELTAEPSMKLYGARHPILTLMNPATVPNDIEIGTDYRCLILSGANTGGKTVLLKTIGLCALMAMHGLHVPASPDSRIGIFSSILADIGDDQNLVQSLSTFSGQLAVIRDMLLVAGRSTLIIIDEIIVGTDPRQGAALAQAVLEELIERQCCIVVTTHYNELKELATKDPRFKNASVSFNPDSLKPDYLLHYGIPGISYALEIAKICGLPDGLIERARMKLDDNEMDADALIGRIQRLEESIRAERENLAAYRQELDAEKSHILEERRKISEKERDLSRKEGIPFLEELKERKRTIAEKIKSLEGADIRESWKTYELVRGTEQDIASAIRKDDVDSHRERFSPAIPESLSVGQRVFIASLDKEGEVTAIDRDEGTATVHLGGSFISRYRINELLVRQKSGVKRPAAKRKQSREGTSADDKRVIPLTIQTSYNTIDLRGMRVHDALNKMDAELDRMTRNAIESAVIIHGHGTGALKEAVRQNLASSIYVTDSRPGDYGEGGDGVTIVMLRFE